LGKGFGMFSQARRRNRGAAAAKTIEQLSQRSGIIFRQILVSNLMISQPVGAKKIQPKRIAVLNCGEELHDFVEAINGLKSGGFDIDA